MLDYVIIQVTLLGMAVICLTMGIVFSVWRIKSYKEKEESGQNIALRRLAKGFFICCILLVIAATSGYKLLILN